MAGRKSIGFSFNIKLPTEITATPKSQNIANSFDYMANLVSLTRLDGESNIDFKKRIWDARVHPAGPDYEGVLNAISREFGYIRERTLTIDLKYGSDGSPIAPSPRVDILANRIVLYSDWRPDGTEVIDKEIRTYQLGDTGYYLANLVDEINTSEYFSATIEPGIRRNLHSSCLVRETSDFYIMSHGIKADRITIFDFDIIIKGSVIFEEKGIFETEVLNPSESGEYYIDYTEGFVKSYDIPSGDLGCSFHAAVFPMIIDSLPIQIFSFQDDNFQDELFEKRRLESGEVIRGLPNPEGADIYNQLFMKTKVFWGK